MDNKDKVALTPKEAEWFEENKHLPFYSFGKNFSTEAYKKAKIWSNYEEDEWEKYVNRLSKAYFVGCVVKEKKYYIKLGFGNCRDEYLNVNKRTGVWSYDTRTNGLRYKTIFTQEEIDEMQKDPRAKGLDLNVLKVEVPED
ncbi:DUF1642 domain-containing protein [Lactobacillus taiwanensis]|uniref:DUF1642 domain-containing protein n=1 Tax=Lactobacillus taiwanensis TaxID=508451 RepID=UPI0032200B0D